MSDVHQALHDLRERIARSCRRVGRDAATVTLIGAAKTVAAERIRSYLEAGLTDVGENYVQEGVDKIRALQAAGHVARWHYIGALQSNKAGDAVRIFDLIHSVDRVSLATALDRAARAQNKVQEVLLQVNIGGEATKAGCAPESLRTLAQTCARLPNLALRGLMCLPPYHEDPEQVRPYFRQLREARDGLMADLGDVFGAGGNNSVVRGHLSMGMSHDFEVAVEEGATLIRIGTALFGPRAG